MKLKRWSKEWWIETLQPVGWFLAIVAAVAIVWVIYAKHIVPWLSKSMITSETGSGYGQFGDMFGGLNTIFAGLAFAFVAVAAYFQRQTMRSQKEELEATKAQAALQAFEPLFFQLIELFRDLRQGVHLTSSASPPTGYPRINGLLESPDVEQYIRQIAQHGKFIFGAGLKTGEARAQALNLIKLRYEELHLLNEGELGPMFRTLYHAIRLIADSGLPQHTQVRYANIARGVLGGEFLLLLMLNCLSTPGEGMKPFVEHFGLLKHIRRDPGDGSDLFVSSFFEPSALVGFNERLALWGADGPPALPA